MKVQFNLFLA